MGPDGGVFASNAHPSTNSDELDRLVVLANILESKTPALLYDIGRFLDVVPKNSQTQLLRVQSMTCKHVRRVHASLRIPDCVGTARPLGESYYPGFKKKPSLACSRNSSDSD